LEEKKIGAKRKNQRKGSIRKTSSSNDDSQADHSNADPGEVSSPKKQKNVAESHVRVSYLIFPFDLFGEILILVSFYFPECDFTIGNYF
jgi:hypothetical protein